MALEKEMCVYCTFTKTRSLKLRVLPLVFQVPVEPLFDFVPSFVEPDVKSVLRKQTASFLTHTLQR